MGKQQSQNRYLNRYYLKTQGAISIKNQLPLSEWMEEVASNVKEGQKSHEEHVENVTQQQNEKLAEREDEIRERMESEGYDEEAVNAYIEQFRQNALTNYYHRKLDVDQKTQEKLYGPNMKVDAEDELK